jgi:RND family efflux transporter MFP subunit
LVGGVIFLVLLLAGVFQPKVGFEKSPAAPFSIASPGAGGTDLQIAEVRLVRRPVFETAVGTVRAVHESAVASKLLARIVEVRVKAGQTVSRDEVLVRLDDEDLQARLKQAEAVVAAAKAACDSAEGDYSRRQKLLPSGAVSNEEFERAATNLKTAKAELERAQQGVHEAKVLLDFATIRAPLTGIVIDKRVETGDTVTPGTVLLNLYNPSRMQMVATVRESLATRLQVGQKLGGRLESLNHECEATVSEIVPEAQTASRSFQVKVTGPCPPGVYSGMFGRIFIPLGEEEVVTIPTAAVFHIGQLDMVQVLDTRTSASLRRAVQLGRKLDGDYEVLSGLKPGERVILHHRSTEARP